MLNGNNTGLERRREGDVKGSEEDVATSESRPQRGRDGSQEAPGTILSG